jgi:hypothetical protein
MSPTPKRQPMTPCPHGGAMNDPNRGSTRCWSCNLPLSKAAAARYERAVDEVAQILADVRAQLGRQTPEQAADAAYVPGGPSREEIAAKVRALRAQPRRAPHAA